MSPWPSDQGIGAQTHQDGPDGQSTPDAVSTVNTYVAGPSTAVQRARADYAGRHRCQGCGGTDDAGFHDDPETDVAPGIPASGRWSELEAVDATDPLLARYLDGDR
jgi:hypothetical protein